MATANTNKTIFALGIVAVLGFLAYKLWPAIRRAINSGSSGGGGGGVGPASAASNPYGYSSEPNSSGPSLGANFGGGQPGSAQSGAALSSALRQSLQNLIGSGSYANSTPAQQEYINTMADQLPSDYPDQIAYEPLQNFDVNQLAFSPDSLGTDTSSYDPSAYADTLSVDPGLYIDDGSGDGSGDGGGDGVSAGGDGGY
ncbi:MAG: hypothetical protein ABSE36_11755 [Terracidiphilus sp.]|jgi:hypothetical protein